MTEEARLHIERAESCIAEAQTLLTAHWPAATVARAYYAMFHAATAALLDRDIRRRSHKGLISAFGQYLVKSGQIDPAFHRSFTETFDLRQHSDYQPLVDLTDAQAAKVLAKARDFVDACKNLLP